MFSIPTKAWPFSVPAPAPVRIHVFGVSPPSRVSSPEPPERTPLRPPPAVHLKVSAAAPPVRF